MADPQAHPASRGGSRSGGVPKNGHARSTACDATKYLAEETTLRSYLAQAALAAVVLTACATPPPAPGKPEFMLVGIDTKAVFADDGTLTLIAPGTDLVAIVDIGTDPAKPRIVSTL